MATGARKRATPDFAKWRGALAGPGMDTRCWVAIARVDDDPDAVRFDRDHGWIVDVTVHGGPLDQQDGVAARVGGGVASDGAIGVAPVSPGDELLIAFPTGNPNDGAVALVRLNNGELQAPSTINSRPLTEAVAAANLLLASSKGLQLQLGAAAQVAASSWQLLGSQIYLGGSEVVPPTEPLIKGLAFSSALATWVASLLVLTVALGVFATAIGSAVPALSAPAVTLNTAIGKFAVDSGNFLQSVARSLSRKVFTE